MSKKQFNELELQFQEECEVINLKYEYDGYNGDISWAIISNLTEDEILEKYRSIIGDYMPFIRGSCHLRHTSDRPNSRGYYPPRRF